MILARHSKNPPDEVRFREMRNGAKRHIKTMDDRIAESIQKEIGVNPLEKIKYRAGAYPIARQIFMTIRNNKRRQWESLQTVADIFDTKHDYILFAVKQIRNRCDTDSQFKEIFDRIKDETKNLN